MKMAQRIEIAAGRAKALAELNESETAQAVWDALPIDGVANTWGDEVYFSIPLVLEMEAGQEVVQVGDLGYWPPGRAFCIFFGPTPASDGDEIRPASAVTVFGRIVDDATVFKGVTDGTRVTVRRRET
jgi:hypothetical protein